MFWLIVFLFHNYALIPSYHYFLYVHNIKAKFKVQYISSRNKTENAIFIPTLPAQHIRLNYALLQSNANARQCEAMKMLNNIKAKQC